MSASAGPASAPRVAPAQVVVGTTEGLTVVGSGHELDGREVSGLAPGPHGWWAVVDGTLWHGEPGQGWEEVAGLADQPVRCVLAAGGQVLVGTAGAGLHRLEDGGLAPVVGFEQAPTRERWHTPWGGPPDTRSLASADGAWYVNVHVGGILRSHDGGATWQPTIDLHTDVHQVEVSDGEVLAATGVEGLAVSRDRGATWTTHTHGLHASYARAVATADGTVLLSASTGPGGGRGALYRRPLAGDEPFVRCDAGPGWFSGNIDTHCLAATHATVAFGTATGDVFVSEDGGVRWQPAAAGLARVRCVAVTV
ncbi:MAG TPA: sialidase family protein [Nitriliruptorales bacterium]|nr:sialidase family protein [Nitriliruptorales bacterium]